MSLGISAAAGCQARAAFTPRPPPEGRETSAESGSAALECPALWHQQQSAAMAPPAGRSWRVLPVLTIVRALISTTCSGTGEAWTLLLERFLPESPLLPPAAAHAGEPSSQNAGAGFTSCASLLDRSSLLRFPSPPLQAFPRRQGGASLYLGSRDARSMSSR